MQHPMTINAEYPLHQTPKGKTIEVRPDGVYGLWVINPHGTNLPKNLKNAKFTTAEEGSKAVLKWIDTIEVKEQEAVKAKTEAEIIALVEAEVAEAINEKDRKDEEYALLKETEIAAKEDKVIKIKSTNKKTKTKPTNTITKQPKK